MLLLSRDLSGRQLFHLIRSLLPDYVSLKTFAPWWLALSLAACADRATFVSAPPPQAAPPLATITCSYRRSSPSLSCAEPTAAGAPGRDVLLGGQGIYVRLASSGTAYDSVAQVLTSSVTVRNLTAQPIGTDDGFFQDGLRVAFVSGPTVTAGTGTVTVQSADGTGTFTAAGQPYIIYYQVLQPHVTSAPRIWRFSVPRTVAAFSFQVMVDAVMPSEQSPLRWIREAGALTRPNLVALGGSGENVLAVGPSSTILRHTEDGWAHMSAPGTVPLSAVFVAPDGRALATGSTGSLSYNGYDWQVAPNGSVFDLAGTSFDDVWGVRSNGPSHWNGVSWNLTLFTTATLKAVAADPAAGAYLAVGRKPVGGQVSAVVVKITTGVAEQVVDTRYDYHLLDVATGSDGSAVAVGNLRQTSGSPLVGVVLRRDSVNGAWAPVVENADSSLTEVFRHHDGSYVVLSATRAYRLAGIAWSELPNSAHIPFQHGYLAADSIFYATSVDNVYRYGPDGWTAELPAASGSALFDVWAGPGGGAFASGIDRILRRGSGLWTQTAAFPGHWYGVSGSSGSNVHAVGLLEDSVSGMYSAVAAHFDGSAWTAATLPRVTPSMWQALRGVWVADDSHAFAVGFQFDSTGAGEGYGIVGQNSGSGWSLARSSSDLYIDLYSVSGSSSSDVWAVGARSNAAPGVTRRAAVAHWDGGSWTTTVLADQAGLYSVWVASPTSAFAVGQDSTGKLGVIYRYDGASWTQIYKGGNTLFAVWGTTPTNVYASGMDGTMLHYNGINWIPEVTGSGLTLGGLSGSSVRDLFAVGNSGSILHAIR